MKTRFLEIYGVTVPSQAFSELKMPMNQFEYFVSAAENLSFTQAADTSCIIVYFHTYGHPPYLITASWYSPCHRRITTIRMHSQWAFDFLCY